MDIKKCKYKIVVDSREKVNNHILNKFKEGFENKPSHHDMYRRKKSTYSDPVKFFIQEKGLKVGDYTIAIQLPNKEVLNFQDKVIVERKADLNELCCNLFDSKSKDKEGLTRFERELKRGYERGIKIHLIVEVADMHSKIEKILCSLFSLDILKPPINYSLQLYFIFIYSKTSLNPKLFIT